jgi:DNA-binding PadR family transcriptional regulator
MSARARSSGAKGMRSHVYWALLGLVIERPSYGYELIARFERVYGDVLPISSDSQMYNALNVLEGRSLIRGTLLESPVSIGTDRQPKRHYRATDLGREGYRAQLVEQMREVRRHSQRLARQLAVFARRPQMALEIIDGIEEVFLEEAIRAPIPSPSLRSAAGSGSALVDRLAAEESRLAMEATLPWIEYARATFKALAEEKASPG